MLGRLLRKAIDEHELQDIVNGVAANHDTRHCPCRETMKATALI